MSTDPGYYDIENPILKRGMKNGGGGGIGGPGPGPAGGFLSYAGGFPGMSSGGYDFNDPASNPRAALLRKIMAAIQAMQGGDTVDAKLAPGEFVLNREAVQAPGALPMLRDMNDEGMEKQLQHYFLGGLVDKLKLPDWAEDLGKKGLQYGATAGLSMIPGVGVPLAAMASQALMNAGEYSSLREGLMDVGGAGVKAGALDGVGDALEKWRVTPEPNPDLVRGLGRRTMEEPQHFAYGGMVRQRYGAGTAGAPTAAPVAPPNAAGGGWASRVRGRAATMSPSSLQPAPTYSQSSMFGGNVHRKLGAPLPNTPPPTPAPGDVGLPTSWYDELIKKYGQAGAFDPGYGMSELEAALNRQNQGAQEADVRDLMASGMDDPSLYAAQLLASRGARSKQASSTMADARLKQIQSAQDFARQLLGSRHDDQIAELLKRIK